MATLLLLLLSWRARQVLPIWGDRCPEEMRNSTRLWIRRDPSLPRDSWQPFYWLGHHSRAAVIAHSWRTVDHWQPWSQHITPRSRAVSCTWRHDDRMHTWLMSSLVSCWLEPSHMTWVLVTFCLSRLALNKCPPMMTVLCEGKLPNR